MHKIRYYLRYYILNTSMVLYSNQRGVWPINVIEQMFHAIVAAWALHDDVIKWKHFPRSWPFVRGIPRSPVNSPHKGQWRGALMFSLICNRINGWVNNVEAGDLRHHRAHYVGTVMLGSEKRMIIHITIVSWYMCAHFLDLWRVLTVLVMSQFCFIINK